MGGDIVNVHLPVHTPTCVVRMWLHMFANTLITGASLSVYTPITQPASYLPVAMYHLPVVMCPLTIVIIRFPIAQPIAVAHPAFFMKLFVGDAHGCNLCGFWVSPTIYARPFFRPRGVLASGTHICPHPIYPMPIPLSS